MYKLRVQALPANNIGEVLRRAYLITAKQFEEAIAEYTATGDRTLEDIIIGKGWLDVKTVGFFSRQWPLLLQKTDSASREPLGYYLREAGLLTEEQVETLVAEQKHKSLWVRLGTLAVLKGWLAQSTIDFFIENLYPDEFERSPFVRSHVKKTKFKFFKYW